jgi:hypothetical protein
MKSPLQALIQMGVVPPVTFPTDSRYYGAKTLSYTAPNGQPITYLAPRFVPQPGARRAIASTSSQPSISATP